MFNEESFEKICRIAGVVEVEDGSESTIDGEPITMELLKKIFMPANYRTFDSTLMYKNESQKVGIIDNDTIRHSDKGNECNFSFYELKVG